MRSFRRANAFDLAYCLDGTFRHLMTDADALAHLRAIAASLSPGGIYVLGFDLTDYRETEADEETWTIPEGPRRIHQVQLCLPPNQRDRRERILQFVNEGRTLRRFEYDLRAYDARQWKALLLRSPFRMKAALDPWLRPVTPNALERARYFVLSSPSPEGRRQG